MDLRVTLLSGYSFTTRVLPSYSVKDVKAQIEKEHGMPSHYQLFMIRGLQADDNSLLSEYDIEDSTLQLVLRSPEDIVTAVSKLQMTFYFEERGSTLNSATALEQREALWQVGELLARHPYLNLLIEGHATPGAGPTATQLSMQRAEACLQHITGVSRARIHLRGVGSSYPAVPGGDVELNRRVELYVLMPDRHVLPQREDCLMGPLPCIEDELFPPEDAKIIQLPSEVAATLGRYVAINKAKLRCDEPTDSKPIGWIPMGTVVDVLGLGADRRRAYVHVIRGVNGWLSLAKEDGKPLLRKLSRRFTAP
mmetsp:Transcript_88442/g.156856  ORF Transcript_88442/g.156856 Transcript_88442/m.156856 type:complete len:309 (-) Transcript_88442:4-930(-)